MKWGTGGWAAILYSLLALQGAQAQPVRPMPARLGLPGDTSVPSLQIELLPIEPTPGVVLTGEKSTPSPAGDAGKDLLPGDKDKKPEDKKSDDKKPVTPPKKDDDLASRLIQVFPPPAKRLFRLEPESAFLKRTQKDLEGVAPTNLPPIPPATARAEMEPRTWAQLWCVAEPNYVCSRRLWFEQRAFERDGWYIGILQPPISALIFYTDILKAPVYWALDPCRDFECNAGLCLPGDPTPLRWYLRVK